MKTTKPKKIKPHQPATCLAKGMFGRNCPKCEAYRQQEKRQRNENLHSK